MHSCLCWIVEPGQRLCSAMFWFGDWMRLPFNRAKEESACPVARQCLLRRLNDWGWPAVRRGRGIVCCRQQQAVVGCHRTAEAVPHHWGAVRPGSVRVLTAYADTRDWVGAVRPHTPQSLFLEKSDQKTRHAPFGQIPIRPKPAFGSFGPHLDCRFSGRRA